MNRKKSPVKVKIHDNGGRPFEVLITPTSIQVYSNQDKWNKTWKNYLNIWIGEDECDKKFSYGNNILVHLSKNQYLFIGMEIVSFTLKRKVVDFYSPIGNNDVPYPWFSDDQNYVYLLTTPSEIEYFKVSDEMLKTYGNCASSSLCERTKCKKSDPYKQLWVEKNVPKVYKLQTKLVHSRV